MLPNPQRGITLVELMITIAVLAILLVIGVPSFGEYVERSRLRGAADEYVSLVQRARSESISIGLPVSVTPGGSTDAWCFGADAPAGVALGTQLTSTAATCNCTTDGACIVNGTEMRVQAASYQNVTVDAIDVGDGFVIDARLGTLQDLDVAPDILFSSPNYQVRVQVSSLGHARACVPGDQRAISGIPTC